MDEVQQSVMHFHSKYFQTNMNIIYYLMLFNRPLFVYFASALTMRGKNYNLSTLVDLMTVFP